MKRLRRHTFTLLEVLIASIILAGLAVALFGFSSYVTKSWQQLQIKRNQVSELLVIDRAVDAIFPNIIPFSWPDPEEDTIVERPILVAMQSSLRCAYMHRLNDLEEGAIRFAEIFVDDDKLIVKYSDRPFHSWDDAGDRIWETTLAEAVDSIEFNYADWDSDITIEDWYSRLIWRDDFENGNIDDEEDIREDVPLAIRFIVHFQDGRNETWFRRTMGNGYRERFGKWEAHEDL